jgi:RNA polymerase sigma-70 factor (ECF subfamily)
VEREARIETALRQAAEGESQAFAEIVREYQSMVFSIAWHFLGDRALAEDMAQEVFWELYQRLKEIQSAAHLTHWLRRVAVHRCIDQGRRKKSRRDVALDEAFESAAGESPPDSLLLAKLRETLAELSEKQRMVVVLRYQEDLGPAEIAELMGMPVNTVKSTLYRALEELRGKLGRKLKEVRYAFF